MLQNNTGSKYLVGFKFSTYNKLQKLWNSQGDATAMNQSLYDQEEENYNQVISKYKYIYTYVAHN